MHKAALEKPASPLAAIARAYNVTPTDLQVLLAIVEIGGVPEVAAALGVAETKVKIHLARPYKKTGSSRRAVKVVGRFSNRLAG